MTCIVGWVDKNKDIYMGCDSLGTGNGITWHLEDSKIFKNGEFLIGFCGCVRFENIIQYKFKCVKQKSTMDDRTYMYTVFVDTLIKCIKDNGWLKNKEDVISLGDNSVLLVGYKGFLYELCGDLQLNRVSENYRAIGAGKEIALGVLYAVQNESIKSEEKLLKSLRGANHFISSVGPPFRIMKKGIRGKFTEFPIYKE